MEVYAIAAKFLATFLCSLFFGLERQRAHKPIGFGTFIFVSVGSCGLAIAAIGMNAENPLPLLSGIVTGIGFLGAGALIKTTDKIFGFTTAASIWVFAIFGLLMGIGDYVIAMLVYSSIWLVILIDRYFEIKGIGSYQRKLIVKTNRIVQESDIKDLIHKHTSKHKIISVDIDRKNNTLTIVYIIEGRKEDLNQIPKILFEKNWLDSCKIE